MISIKQIKCCFAGGDRRSNNLKFQSILSFAFKVISQFIVFLLVPLQLSLLGKPQYGVWVTLFSITSWIAFADLGLGVGLINKLNIAIGRDDKINARKYVSSAYICVSLIVICMMIIFLTALPFINLQIVFNCSFLSEHNLQATVLMLFLTIMVGFIFQLINSVLSALQKNSYTLLIPIISNILFILVIVLFKFYNISNIFYVAISYCCCQLFSSLYVNISVFKKYSYIRPSFRYFDIERVKDMFSLSVLFFITKISGIIIFSTDNVIITQLFGPVEVVPYSIVMKIFLVIIMIVDIVTLPLWAAYTDAYSKGELSWIKRKIIYHHFFLVFIVFAVLIITYKLDYIVKLWVGNEIEIPILLKVFGASFVILSCWNNIYGLVLFGMSKIRLVAVFNILSALINIPISIYFAKYLDMGIAGILLGTLVSLLINFMARPIQVFYFIFYNNKSKLLEKILS